MKRMKMFSRLLKDENGQSLIIVAAAMIVLLGITAFTVDVGFLFFQKRHLQNTADAAALAAAKELPNGEVEGEALKYAGLHNVNNGEEGTVVETTIYLSTNEVEVYVKKEYGRFFGRIWSNEPYIVSAVARAKYDPRFVKIAPFTPIPETYDDEWYGWVDDEGDPSPDYDYTNDYPGSGYSGRVFVSPLFLSGNSGSDIEDLNGFYNYVQGIEEYECDGGLPGIYNGGTGTIQLGLVNNKDYASRGYVNIDPEESSSGTSEIKSWLEGWEDLDILGISLVEEQTIVDTTPGLRDTIIKAAGQSEEFIEFLDVTDGEFYIFLPHPDLDVTGPHSPIESYLIAKVKIDSIHNNSHDCWPEDTGGDGFYYCCANLHEEYGFNSEEDFLDEQDFILGAKLLRYDGNANKEFKVYNPNCPDDMAFLIDEGVITGVSLTR